MKGFLGVDVGSVSTNIVVVDADGKLLVDRYLRTSGRPIEVVQQGYMILARNWRVTWRY